MTKTLTRRAALKNLTLGAGALLAVRMSHATTEAAKPAASGALPHVTVQDPIAIALAYHENAKTVDASKFANFKVAQNCGNCLQLAPNSADAWQPCKLFAGKLVNVDGWCKVYVKKP